MKLNKTKIAGIYTSSTKSGTTYYGNFRDPITSKPRRKKLGIKGEAGLKNEKDALLLLNELIDELKGLNNQKVDTNTEVINYITLNKLFKMYLESRYIKKLNILREQYNYLSDEEFNEHTTIKKKLYNVKKNEYMYKKHIEKADIASKPINRIVKKDYDDYINIYLASTNLSTKSKYNISELMKTTINWGIKEGIIDISNPLITMKIKNPKNQRDRVLTADEIKVLLDECKKYKKNINVYLSVYLATLTAGRENTILNIQKKDIDVENKTISLFNFKANRKYKTTITNAACKWLNEKILPYYEYDEYLIRAVSELNRTKPYKPMAKVPFKVYKIMDELFNTHLDKTNNYDRNKVVNFHTIRRSIATNLAKSGIPLYDVMIFLNHSNIEQTMKYLNMESNSLTSGVDSLMQDIFKKDEDSTEKDKLIDTLLTLTDEKDNKLMRMVLDTASIDELKRKILKHI